MTPLKHFFAFGYIFDVVISTQTVYEIKFEIFYVSEMCLLCSPWLHVFGQKYSKNSNIATAKIFLCSTTAIIFNRAPLIIVNKWAPNQHTGMISEGSCDTEDLE